MKMPIVEMLRKYAKSNATRLHMPGHKGKGLAVNPKMDITELAFSDNLMNPTNVISQSQSLFANEWNARFAFYTVNGSTAGIFAMIANARGSILIQRSSHIAVYNAIKTFGKKAYVINDYDVDLLPNNLTAIDLEQVTKENPDIKTWVLTSPSYYGKVLDLPNIRKKADKLGVTIFIDSAHGAHFGLSECLPKAAHIYADAAVISAHKTLPAFTQTAVLLTNNEKLAGKLKETLNCFSTTSPSYLLLASIDYARAYAVENKNSYQKLYSEVQRFFEKLPNGIIGEMSDDFSRIVLDVTATNLSGYEAEKLLAQKNIFVEFADKKRVVAIVTLMDGQKTLRRFAKALRSLKGKSKIANCNDENCCCTNEKFTKQDANGFTNQILKFDKLTPLCFNDKVKRIKFADSEGEISAMNAGITPPCCPVIVAGEKIKKFQIDMLDCGEVFGIKDGYILVKE